MPNAGSITQFNATKWLIGTLAGVSLLSFALVTYIHICIQPTKDTISYEIAKSLIQLGVVAVAGTVFSLLVFEYQRRRQNFDKRQEEERQDARNKAQEERRLAEVTAERARKQAEDRESLLNTMKARAVASYNIVKRARRLLRARGRTDSQMSFGAGGERKVRLRLGRYDEYVDHINSAQLELEALIRETHINRDRIAVAAQMIVKLSLMEKYLAKIVREYENRRWKFHDVQEEVELKDLPVVASFLQSAKDDKTFEPFSQALKGLLALAADELSGREGDGRKAEGAAP